MLRGRLSGASALGGAITASGGLGGALSADTGRRSVQAFATVADMQAADHLCQGMVAHTDGFHASGDGGAAYYAISASGAANGMDVLALRDGLYASLVVTEAYVTPEMLGAWGDDSHDDIDALQYAVDHYPAVRMLDKTYMIGGTLTVPNACESVVNGGTLRYTGASYAVELVACVNKSHDLGTMYAAGGSCVLIDSAHGWSQYVNISFTEFRAQDKCVHLRCPSSWVNEVRIYRGKFAAGAYGVYFENGTGGTKGHLTLCECGFEGVVTGVFLHGVLSEIACYGCRMEEGTSYVVDSDNAAWDTLCSFTWFGKMSLAFIKATLKFPVYVYGRLFDASGNLVSTECLVFDGMVYGRRRQYQVYVGGWDSATAYTTGANEKTLSKSIAEAVRSTYFRLPYVSSSMACTLVVHRDFITPHTVNTVLSNEVYIDATISSGGSVAVKDENGNTLTMLTATGVYKMFYVANWGYEFESVSMTRAADPN